MAADNVKLSVFTAITENNRLSEKFGIPILFIFPNSMSQAIQVCIYLVLLFRTTIKT